ncbi:MAG: amidase [Actinobacteria bacterium]|nr:amidase [Actinomycetota bacterium]
MRSDEYTAHDALGLAALVEAGEVTAAEVLDAALAAIDARNPELNAVVSRADDAARADVARGLPAGPLRGVPYLIKDLNAHVAGLPSTQGVRLFADQVAEVDSEFVGRLRRAGAVIVGKTNTPGFGSSTSTEPGLFGPCRNPWDPSRSAGGSSGGAASAVAGGMVPAAHATDGGGSIRIPASCCGLFGLKTTRGRITHAPYAGEGWNGMSVGHAVTRTVRDSAAILDATRAPFPGDPYVAPQPARPYLDEVGADPGRLRIALLDRQPVTGLEPEPEVRAGFEAAARLLDTLGHHVEPARWPELPMAPTMILGTVSSTHIANAVDQRLAALGRDLRDDDLDRWIHVMVERGRSVTGEEYVQAVAAMHAVGRTIAGWMADYDVLCTPTMAITPPPIGVMDPNAASIGDVLTYLGAMGGFLNIANITGQPAMSVPLHRASDGIPVGIHFVGRFGDEATLVRLAAQLEHAAPWPMRP